MSSIEKELHDSGIEKKEFIEKIKYLALKLGRELKLSPEKLEDLSPLAEVYDIGKVAINKNLLFKKEKLTKKEFDEIKRHAEISYNILKYNASLSRITEEALYHHEWWDGSGYPQGLKGKEIPVLSRIIAIVEAYMVMITGTEYKKPVSPETAINEIKRGSGTQFDPVLVERFIWKERL
jgi:HD-GYP domain-containing protein (c-di-GMP phosphodiesterase class II)